MRGVDDDLIVRLKARAAERGRSAEAEHREILRRALAEGSAEVPFGALRGKIRIAPDFDETPVEIIDAHGARRFLTLLLDTHVLLWLLADPERLTVATRERIADPETDVFVSIVSLWEIVVKRRVGKLDADVAAITAQLHPNSKLRWLGVTPKHLLTLDSLIAAEHHRDPFDHLLIAQAIAEGDDVRDRRRTCAALPGDRPGCVTARRVDGWREPAHHSILCCGTVRIPP